MHIRLFVAGTILGIGGLVGAMFMPGVAGVQCAIAFVAGCILAVGGAILERLVMISRSIERSLAQPAQLPRADTTTAASNVSVTGEPLPPPR